MTSCIAETPAIKMAPVSSQGELFGAIDVQRRHPLLKRLDPIIDKLAELPEAERVEVINEIKKALHAVSPFKDEPVDCVLWVQSGDVQANDYNPNAVAPPEMKLLALSIEADGYTQPIVTFKRESVHEVIDGFHRNRVGKEVDSVRERVRGYLPVVAINSEREDRGDRIAATIRHNRARGKHKVDAMSEIVLELKRRNWSDAKIGKELGMDPDEVLRLAQITGLAEMFADREFSQAWEAADAINETDNLNVNEEINGEGEASL
jgi:ParB-like chromosome segregation protein Spo0J